MNWVWNLLTIFLTFFLNYIAIMFGVEAFYYVLRFTGLFQKEVQSTLSFCGMILSYLHFPNAELEFTRIHFFGILLMIGSVLFFVILPYLPILSGLLRWIRGQHKPDDEDMAYLEPALALLSERDVPVERYHFFVARNLDYNAFASGAGDITIFAGLLRDFPPEEIAGIICHEMGHHVHGDTKQGDICYGMALVGYGFLLFLQGLSWVLALCRFIPVLGFITVIISIVLNLLMIAYRYLLQLPSGIVELFFNRQIEYAADNYALECGFGEELTNSLIRLYNRYGDPGFFSILFLDHPRTRTRIKRLQKKMGEEVKKHWESASDLTWKQSLVYFKRQYWDQHKRLYRK